MVGVKGMHNVFFKTFFEISFIKHPSNLYSPLTSRISIYEVVIYVYYRKKNNIQKVLIIENSVPEFMGVCSVMCLPSMAPTQFGKFHLLLKLFDISSQFSFILSSKNNRYLCRLIKYCLKIFK